jgi:hypothetical protein
MATNTRAEEKTIVSAQVPTVTRDELLRRAEQADRSLSAEIRTAIREHLTRDDQEEA